MTPRGETGNDFGVRPTAEGSAISGSNVVAVGMRLGSANRVRAMRYFKSWGWTATDITGAEYAQRFRSGADPYARKVCPDGLGGCPWPDEPAEPPKPKAEDPTNEVG